MQTKEKSSEFFIIYLLKTGKRVHMGAFVGFCAVPAAQNSEINLI